MKKVYRCTDTKGKVTIIEKEMRDTDHFNAQLNYKSITFIDRKKRAKSGYQKHKPVYNY